MFLWKKNTCHSIQAPYVNGRENITVKPFDFKVTMDFTFDSPTPETKGAFELIGAIIL